MVNWKRKWNDILGYLTVNCRTKKSQENHSWGRRSYSRDSNQVLFFWAPYFCAVPISRLRVSFTIFLSNTLHGTQHICSGLRLVSNIQSQWTSTHTFRLSVMLLQCFSLNRCLSFIIKLSSEHTVVCLVCTLPPLIHSVLLFLLRWHYRPLRTWASIMDFFQSGVFDCLSRF